MCEMPVAIFPITWIEAQGVFGQLGYGVVSHDAANSTVTLRLTGEGRTEGLRNPVTIKRPDFVCDDRSTPAYERDYIVDLISQMTGGNGGKPLATFFANRRTN
jgi:hypothetical protein